MQPHLPVSDRFEREMPGGEAEQRRAWYSSQKEHWLGWLAEYDGPGAYSRKNTRKRDAQFVYNHIVNPKMLIWLAEAAGVPKQQLQRAYMAALSAGTRMQAMSSAIRHVIPFSAIQALLGAQQGRERNQRMREILHLTLHREFFAAIAAGKKRTEYRQATPYWRKRLEGRSYDAILFRNGYARSAPEMLVEFHGVRREGRGAGAEYAIRLGKVLKIKRWPIR